MNFQVGDIVRRLQDGPRGMKAGDTYEVREVDRSGDFAVTGIENNGIEGPYFMPRYFELVSRPTPAVDYIDTRDGWREGTSGEYMHQRHLGNPTLISEVGMPLSTDMQRVYWVREEPVPPLPTEPNTWIEVKPGRHWWFSDSEAVWHRFAKPLTMGAAELQKHITGFKVLAMPPARVHELPTEDDTVIQVTEGGVKRRWLRYGQMWSTVLGDRLQRTDEELAAKITSFNVLAVPPARAHELPMKTDEQVRREARQAAARELRARMGPWIGRQGAYEMLTKITNEMGANE